MDEHIRTKDGFEHIERQFLLNYLQSGMCVLDIGAHHGLYTLLAPRMVGSSGRVIAFEPSPRERKRLFSNIRLNRYTNITVEPYALATSSGTGTLHICLGRETGCNSLRPPSVDESTEASEVPLTSVDDYVKKKCLSIIDFIKLDVEGAELDVLTGASTLLQQTSRPVFLAELADIRTIPSNYKSVAIYDFLAGRNYRWFSVTVRGSLQSAARKELFHENLVSIPEEKVNQLKRFMEI